jgi:hypothetical protein
MVGNTLSHLVIQCLGRGNVGHIKSGCLGTIFSQGTFSGACATQYQFTHQDRSVSGKMEMIPTLETTAESNGR